MFYTILTEVGQAKLANATALGTTVDLTHIAVGDGNGVAITPDQTATALDNEVWRASLNSISIDTNNANWIIAEGYIPSTDGGFTVREVGLFDVAGDMIAIGSYPDTYKPTLASGSAKDLYIKVIIEVNNAATVELKIDPAVVLASRKWVDDNFYDIAKTASFKNKIINGDFSVWQRGVSFNVTGYTADRWGFNTGDGVGLVNRLTFLQPTAGVNPFSKHGLHFELTTATSASSSNIYQKIEDVRTYNDEPVTLSFSLRNSLQNFSIIIRQNFGDGGSTSVDTPVGSISAINASFVKKSLTVEVPSIAGKTIGENSNFQILFTPAHGNIGYIDIANIQIESGTKETFFEQKAIGLELSLCQRYYETGNMYHSDLIAVDNSSVYASVNFLAEKRVVPSILSVGGISYWGGAASISGAFSVLGFVSVKGATLRYGSFTTAPVKNYAYKTVGTTHKWEADAEL